MQQQRHHFTQSAPLEQRMAEQAKQLRKEAQGTPPGVKRDDLIRRARKIEDRLSHKTMTFVSRPSAAQVNEYRVNLMGHDGHIRSSRTFVCGDDADAIVWAEQMVNGHYIELWSGERFIRRVNATDKPGAVSDEVIDGDRTEEVRPPQPADAKPSREDEARQVAQEYADDQREIIKKLRNPTN